MDSARPLPFRVPVVALAIREPELLAWIALMLEMAGFRVLPLVDIGRFDTATRDIRLRAVVVDVRGGEPSIWPAVRHMLATAAAEAAQVLVIAADAKDVPVDVVADGARVLTWPFSLTDVLLLLEPR